MVTFGSTVQVETQLAILPLTLKMPPVREPTTEVPRRDQPKQGTVDNMGTNGRTDRIARRYGLTSLERENNQTSLAKQKRAERVQFLRDRGPQPQAKPAQAIAQAAVPKPNLSKQKAALSGQARQGLEKMKQGVAEIANAILQQAMRQLDQTDGGAAESQLISAVMHSAFEEAVNSLKMKAATYAKK